MAAVLLYLEVALSGVSATYDDRFELAFRGGALNLGGSLKHFFTSPFALGVGRPRPFI